MANVGELVIQLSANVARLQQDMAKSTRVVDGASRKMTAAIGTVKTALGALGVGLSATALVGLVRNTADAADQLSKLSQKTGIAVEELSALQYAGKLSDVGTEQLQMGVRQLSVNMFDAARGVGEAKDAFDAMGISVKDQNGNLKGATTIINEVADKFARMEDGTGKAALAAKIFGTRVGSELIPLLNGGSAGLKSMREEAERLGVIIDTKTAKAAEQFNDNLTRLNESLEGFRLMIVGPLIRDLAEFTDQLVEGATAGEGFWRTLNAMGNLSAFGDTPAEQLKNIREALDSTRAALDKFGDVPGVGAMLGIRESNLMSMERLAKQAQRKAALVGTEGQILDPRDYAAGIGTRRSAAPTIVPKTKTAAEQVDLPRFNTAGKVEELFKPYREQALAEDLQHARDLERDFTQGVEEDGRRHMEALKKLWDAKDQADEFEKAQAKMKKVGRDTAEELKAAFEGFGRDTSRALAEMATSGEASFSSLRDVARLFFTELIEKILYTQAIAPALDFLTASFGLKTGGAKAFGGPVSPGVSYPVGEHGPEMFVPNVPGDIVPAGAGGSVNIVQHINVDSRSDRASIIAAMNHAREAAKADILRSLSNGGTFAAAMGRV